MVSGIVLQDNPVVLKGRQKMVIIVNFISQGPSKIRSYQFELPVKFRELSGLFSR